MNYPIAEIGSSILYVKNLYRPIGTGRCGSYRGFVQSHGADKVFIQIITDRKLTTDSCFDYRIYVVNNKNEIICSDTCNCFKIHDLEPFSFEPRVSIFED